ncbi:MAG: hypothetical protein ACERK0_02565, partial [Deltaproteobacteria bacterium]
EVRLLSLRWDDSSVVLGHVTSGVLTGSQANQASSRAPRSARFHILGISAAMINPTFGGFVIALCTGFLREY